MTEPYDTAAAGQPITALRWNNMQIKIGTEIEALKEHKLNISGGTVTGTLTVQRPANSDLTKIADLVHVRGAGNLGLRVETGTTPADVAALRFSHGDAVTGWIATWLNGRLSISNQLHLIAGRLGVGTETPQHELHVRGRVMVEAGVIQGPGPSLINTTDLGLYSQQPGQQLRLVTNNAPIRFYADSLIGTTPTVDVQPTGDLKVRRWITAGGGLGVGVDTPQDALHLAAPTGNLGIRLANGAAVNDWNSIRFNHNNVERAFVATHGATGRFTVNHVFNLLNGRVGIGPGTESAIGSTLDVRGDLQVGRPGAPAGLLFNQQHVGWSNSARDRAEISIDPNHKTLMIVGSMSAAQDDPHLAWPGHGRRVSVWDRLEVNGHLWTQSLVAGLGQALRPLQPIHTTGIAVDNGIIQRGGPTLAGTADLGLYSQVQNNWIRIVTNNGGVTFRSDGGIGTVANADILPTGDLKVRRWALAGALGIGVDVPGDLVHLKGAGNIGLRIDSGTAPTDFAALRLLQGGVNRAALYTNNAGLVIESAGTITANAGLRLTGALNPALGNSVNAGIQFPSPSGGDGGDEAFIRYHVESGETSIFRLGVANNPDDSLRLFQAGADRLIVHNGQVTIGTAPYTKGDSRALNVEAEIKSFGGGAGLRMSDRIASDTTARDWVLYPYNNTLNFWQGEAGSIAWLTKDTFSVPRIDARDRICVDNGVIQRGGAWITNTNDLGLYSQVQGNWIRFVTNNGPFVYFSDSGAGSQQIAALHANGHLSICTSSNPINFTSTWQSSPDGVTNTAEICNDTTYHKTLMLVGNRSAGLGPSPGRRVSVWDRLDVNGGAFVNGAVVLASDRALKQDIAPLRGALARALELRPVSFTWNKTGQHDIGLIAQEVEPIFPELITTNEACELGEAPVQVKGLQYNGIAVIAVAAVQELARELASLRRELAELRERNA